MWWDGKITRHFTAFGHGNPVFWSAQYTNAAASYDTIQDTPLIEVHAACWIPAVAVGGGNKLRTKILWADSVYEQCRDGWNIVSH